MKKILIAAFSFCLAAIVTSCGSKAEGTEANVVIDSITEAPVSTQAQTDNEQPAEHGVVKVLTNSDKAEATDKPLVIDFSATWCGPCQRFKPTFHQVAEEYAAKATFATADVDECTDLSTKYKIESIPFVLILNPDGSSASQTGLMTEKEFKTFLDKNLK